MNLTVAGRPAYAYTGGPYPYFPLFLYIELPMQWLALHTSVPFTILGKLPIVAADLAATLLILRKRVWAALSEAGAAHGLVPAGLAARDTLRIPPPTRTFILYLERACTQSSPTSTSLPDLPMAASRSMMCNHG